MSSPSARQPFLGLRHFDEEDADLFFGRDEQVGELLARIGVIRFVAVIGSSGTGKSSLVRAGLVPALRAGFLTTAGTRWSIVTTRPGRAPIRALASKLERVLGLRDVETTLRRGPLGIVEAIGSARQQPAATPSEGDAARPDPEGNGNVLIVVDQFEEIFRQLSESRAPAMTAEERAIDEAISEEAAAFVGLLLEAAARPNASIYVLLTMRSEYLGACSRFRNLAERINEGLYLVPRMRRDQLEEAIEGPAAVAGALFSGELLQRLLNESGDDPDQLPVLQHALRRTWAHLEDVTKGKVLVESRYYESTGGLQRGMDIHAEAIYRDLDDRAKQIVAAAFRCLTELDAANNAVRRRSSLANVAKVVGCSEEELLKALEGFLNDEAALLSLSSPDDKAEHRVLDLTHESLILRWHRLGGEQGRGGWLQQEAALRDEYIELASRAGRAAASAGTLNRSELKTALKWRELNLGVAWGKQYIRDADAYQRVLDYIRRSERAVRLRWAGATCLIALTLAGGLVAAAQTIALRKGEAARQALMGLEKQTIARKLASDAEGLRDIDSRIEVRMLLAIESLNHLPLPEGTAAIRAPLRLLRPPLWSRLALKNAQATPLSSLLYGARQLAYSPDLRYLAINDNGTLSVRKADTGDLVSIPSIDDATSMAWHGSDVLRTVRRVSTDFSATGRTIQDIGMSSGKAVQAASFTCNEDCRLTQDGAFVFDVGLAQIGPEFGGNTSYQRPLPVEHLGKSSEAGAALGAGGAAAQFVVVSAGQRPGRHKPAGVFWIATERYSASSLALSPTGKFFAIANHWHEVKVFRTDGGTNETGSIRVDGEPSSLAISDDGARLVIGDEQGGVRVVDVANRRELFGWAHAEGIVALAMSSDKNQVASLDSSGNLRTTRLPVVSEGTPMSGIGAEIQFDRSGRHFFVQSKVILPKLASVVSKLQIVDNTTGFAIERQPAYGDPLQLAYDEGSDQIAVISKSGQLSVLDFATMKESAAGFIKNPQLIRSVAYSHSNQHLAISMADQLALFDLRTQRSFNPDAAWAHRIVTALFSPDGRYLALERWRPTHDESDKGSRNKLSYARALSNDVVVTLVDCKDWHQLGEWPTEFGFGELEFSQNGRQLLVGSWHMSDDLAAENSGQRRPSLLLIDTALARRLPPRLPGSAIRSSLFSPDGKRLMVSTDRDHMVHVISLPEGFSVDGWPMDSDVTLLGFDKTSRHLALRKADDTVSVFSAVDGSETSRLSLGEAGAAAARFSDDGKQLWVISETRGETHELAAEPHLLDVADLILEGCRRVTRNLRDKEEWQRFVPESPKGSTCPEPLTAGRIVH